MTIIDPPIAVRTRFLSVGAPIEQFADHLTSAGSIYDRSIDAPALTTRVVASAEVRDADWFAMAQPHVAVSGSRTQIIQGARHGTTAVDPGGATLWHAAGDSVDAIYVGDSVVLSGDREGLVKCLEIETGNEKWRRRADDWISAIGMAPGGRILVSSRDGAIRCIDEASGEITWTSARGSRILARAVADDERVCIGARDGIIALLDLCDGSVVAEIETGTDVHATAGRDAEGNFYVGSDDKRLYCIEPTGSIRWTFRTGDAIWAEPSIADGIVAFASTDGNAYGIDAATGAQIWRSWVGGSVRLGLATSGSSLCLVTEGGIASLLDVSTGAISGSVDLGAGSWAPPTPFEDGFIVATFANELVHLSRNPV